MSLELSIPSTSESHGLGKAYTVYHILLRSPMRTLTVEKRYNDFLALHTALTTHTGAPPPMAPPPKTYISGTVGNQVRTEQRREALEAYLLEILKADDSRWRDSPVWRSFLSLPPSYNSSAASSRTSLTSVYSGLPSAPITDPTQWLDSHRELKSQLHDARIFLAKRDQATTVQEQHESSASSKRCLVKASAYISALDAGLKEVAKDQGRMLEGELRRRRDLISAARKERDGLEALAITLAAKKQSTSAAAAPPDRQTALFGARGGGGGGRVLGAPLPETERTRELDNGGVLQFQQQIMQEQEQGVETLLQAVRRQKTLGYAINEELQIQNEILDELDRDVERFGKKQQIASRRVNKIS